MRKILALDASTELASVCVTDGQRWIERREDAGQRHSAIMMDLVRTALDEANLRPTDLDEVAFGAGPGSFTGLRIACGIAQGIGYGAGIPVRAVSSLMAIAQASSRSAVIAAIDARMDQVYWAAYRREGGECGEQREQGDPDARVRWTEVHAPAVCAASAVQIPSDTDWCGAGNAFARFPALVAMLPSGNCIEHSIAISARALAELALAGHGTLDAAEHAMPVYVRDKVAMTSAERMAAR